MRFGKCIDCEKDIQILAKKLCRNCYHRRYYSKMKQITIELIDSLRNRIKELELALEKYAKN